MMDAIKTTLPDQGRKMNSQIMQFGSDWPGMFLCGQDALYLAHLIRGAADSLEELAPDSNTRLRSTIISYAKSLEMCRVAESDREKEIAAEKSDRVRRSGYDVGAHPPFGEKGAD